MRNRDVKQNVNRIFLRNNQNGSQVRYYYFQSSSQIKSYNNSTTSNTYIPLTMPLHEHLEEKRRRSIHQLNETKSCHICQSTCPRRSHSRFQEMMTTTTATTINNYNDDIVDRMVVDNELDYYCDDNITKLTPADALPASSSSSSSSSTMNCGWNNPINPTITNDVASVTTTHPPPTMQTCQCHNDATTHHNWPYSLRVCQACIADDATMGRIRICGICGVVACDENCGLEMVECSDQVGWNNAGESQRYHDVACFILDVNNIYIMYRIIMVYVLYCFFNVLFIILTSSLDLILLVD